MHWRRLPWILPLLLVALLGDRVQNSGRPSSQTSPAQPYSLTDRSPWTKTKPNEVQTAIRNGQRLHLRFGDATKTLLFEPSALLAEQFKVSIGSSSTAILARPEAFVGWAIDPTPNVAPSRATLSILGQQAWGNWIQEDGTTWQFQWQLDSPEITLTEHPAPLTISSINEHSICQIREMAHIPSLPPREFRGEISAQGGLEPATGEVARYLDPIPASESYLKSLKNLDIILVIDQATTGSDAPESLARVASQWLATTANVATIYENQLGIRLRLQELILIPDTPAFTDVPSDNVLADFQDWMAQERPRSEFRWHSAFKVGVGLRSQTLGLAKVRALGTNDSIGVIRASSGWATLAHELGHTLGSDHTIGGLMNGSANEGGNRDFFTEAETTRGRTAAWQIFNHSKDRLPGPGLLRNPTEIPFARNDLRVIPQETALTFNPRTNDLRGVTFGAKNGALSIDSVGQVRPQGAGTVTHDGGELRFQPASGFSGPAWFSYTLRGSIGNRGNGWLHKGDVTVLVGVDPPSEKLVLAPGEARTFTADAAFGSITQPSNAIVHRLIDDERLIIRANNDAFGNDSFSIGSHQFEVTYVKETLEPRPDFYWHHYQFGSLVMEPLANDLTSLTHAVGVTPKVSVGPENGSANLPPNGHGLQLTTAELLTPDKGTLEILQVPSVNAGEATLIPSGTLSFIPNKDSVGQATIRYQVESPTGRSASETITIYLANAAETLLDRNSIAQYQIPRTSIDETAWQNSAFNSASWSTGNLPIGYEDGRGYEEVIQTDVGQQMANVNSSIYVRIPFEVTSVNTVSRLLLNLRMDDGFVAYINGKEVVRDNTPDAITWEAKATISREADAFVAFDITDARSVLRNGDNLLAIHGMNSQVDSSDFLLMPELIALTLPSLATIENPAFDSISVAIGNGIVFEQRHTPVEKIGFPVTAPISTNWQMVEASNNETLQVSPLKNGNFAVQFDLPGTYRIRLSASDSTGLQTSEDRIIHVGDALAYDQVAHVVDTPPVEMISDFSSRLVANIQSDTPWITPETRWLQLDGPAESVIDAPEHLTTTAHFPRTGRYEFRFTASISSIIVFRDVHIDVNTIDRVLIGQESQSSYQYFQNEKVPSTWSAPFFDDNNWLQGGQGLGYDVTDDFTPYITTDIQPSMQFAHSSVYARYPFSLENAGSVHRLDLELRLDDGGLVYLNGQEVYRQHAPLYDLGPDSTAVRSADESSIEAPTPINLAEFRGALRQGTNTLAIHGLNVASTSSDFLIHPTLTATLGAGTGAPADLTQEELLSYALGTDPLPKLRFVNRELELRFRERSDLRSKGGNVVVETSADLKQWFPWKASSRTSTASAEDGFHEIVLAGPKTTESEFVRLTISF